MGQPTKKRMTTLVYTVTATEEQEDYLEKLVDIFENVAEMGDDTEMGKGAVHEGNFRRHWDNQPVAVEMKQWYIESFNDADGEGETVEGVTEAEAVGKYLTDYPNMRYADIEVIEEI